MKKSILAVILIIGAVFCAFGQNSGPIDLVLLLDTSSGMGSSYEKVNDYITGAFLSEFLRTGDTFHLITFSASPRLDIARRISSRGDVETIIGRMLIQYPVETGYNARAAVGYAEEYVSSLPLRPKKIVMLSSGNSDINNIVSAARQRLSSRNTTLDLVSVTSGQSLANLPSSGRSAPPSRQTPSQQSPSSSGTAASGTTGSGTTLPETAGTTPSAGATTPSTATQGTSTSQTTQGTSQTTQQGTSQTGTQSTTTQTQQPVTSSDSTKSPVSGSDAAGTGSSAQGASSSGGDKPQTSEQSSDSFDQSSAVTQTSPKKLKDTGDSFNPSLLLIIGIIAALLLLILLIIFVSRRLGSSPNRVMASVSTLGQEKEEKRFADHSKDLASYAAKQNRQRVTPYSDRPVKEQSVKQPEINPAGPLLLNLFVEDQNTSIGKRNIHSLKSGYSLSVGGGKSDDFMIFLVPMPSHLGEIRRKGSQLTFIPRKPKYFPDIGSNEVRDCINKRIRIVSDKNYEMWFSFVMYEDPLTALNRVLHSIKVPG
ncbi:MAG: hypothetical protein LBI04_11690 [Treponema sp.]|jgi:hypothetical protein|nr:hypothetical protein [Treponema sp.]